ncbi:protein impact protein [Diplodia corticola]|uniref:Protein impact protein n=1 Tax=Diplodia corticola TaxID=236234 RepID=A0A1J9S4J4_9PEZI|nr:protein impact protein [Diplodia corticola]OJD39875.1 protein impact protein [Diplodia corticola]
MAAPSIPQRPSRSQQSQNVPTITGDVPQIPARPKRSIERSVSRDRDTFARSPLNDPSFVNGSSKASKRLSASDLPPRPPSVTLPSIGQEGSEYASLETPPADESAPRETRDAEGLKLYAPTAEMPRSTARSRIAAVTRTDSQQAAAAGFGRAPSQETERHTRNSSSTGRRSRPQSLYNNGDEEHGIPEIGLQVPMYPNAGDVQAPTPSNNSSMPATGVGFFNSGGQRHHARTKSGHEIFHGPPGSYGLHGHGVKPQDDFERQWYAKHPHDAAREAQGEYGPAIRVNRKEWALSSEELNKIVQETATKGVGMGASPGAIGTPAEEIGYMASEEYASRMASPQPPSSSKAPKERKTSSQTHLESPLRKTSFPENVMDKDSSAIEADEDDVIHIHPPTNERSRIHGGGPEAENFAPGDGSTNADDGFVTEEGGRTPILASDELQRHKTPGAEYMQPAVPPELERERRLSQEADNYHRRSTSRPSRPTSGIGFSRMKSEEDRNGTPLDNVKEYEPLFPDEDERKPADKPVTAVDKLKRPDLARHHFPSQDVWEDTPSSLQLQTEVETPEAPDEPQSATTSMQSSQLFEKPEAEQERKEEAAPKEEEESSFLADHQKHHNKSHFNKDVLGDMPSRPGMQHRFPSQDIWEDTPSELQLVTEVHAPQTDETESPVESKPAAEQRPQVPARPHVPARPAGRSKLGESQEASPVDKKAPVIPERPKPQLPARPAKPNHKPSDEQVPLSKVGSQGSTGSEGAPAAKAKPPVPSRPAGGKIAALKAGFLSDLNSRLQLGPQAPKPEKKEEEEEEPKEKAPLVDARKGRARGPARRKPAASSSAAAAAAPAEAKKEQTLSIGTIQTVFSISDDGDVDVPSSVSAKETETNKEELPTAAEESIATQVPADPKPAPSDDPAEPELEPQIPKAGEMEATQVESTPAAEEEKGLELEPTETKTSDSAVQTGQQDIVIPKEEGGAEKLTAYLGGSALEEGNVVVKENAEAVEKADDKHEAEQTGASV